ncbi:PqiB family protein [Schauerella aestuarii]|uniref:PqiB family protein n=1 Tax=Schauerella aestuarii TaxID=2511204 RepID=UPI001367FCB3|nr:MlaD family protein [Achromobacter aestuarii]
MRQSSSSDTPSASGSLSSKPPRGRLPRLWWVWLLPLAAAIAGVGLLMFEVSARGPTITIRFQDVEGVAADRTRVQYKHLDAGVVKAVRLSDDRRSAIVTVQLTGATAHAAQEGSRFWIVRPHWTGSSVSGLSTLLSGAFITLEVPDPARRDGAPRVAQTEFVGMETPPLIAQGRSGTRIDLRTRDIGTLYPGAPVYFRGVKVGDVLDYQLNDDGRGLGVALFVDAPHDAHIKPDTRFWRVGFADLQINASGVRLRTPSALTIAQGGVAFDEVEQAATEDELGERARRLYASEQIARTAPDRRAYRIRMRFEQSIRGLNPGAVIDFNGVVLGRVDHVEVDLDAKTEKPVAWIDARIYPERLGNVFESAQRLVDSESATGKPVPEGLLIKALVASGMRAQLRQENAWSGQQYIALDVFADAPATDVTLAEVTILPTIGSDTERLQQHIDSITARIRKVPIAEIGEGVGQLLAQTGRVIKTIEAPIGTNLAKLKQEAEAAIATLQRLQTQNDGRPATIKRANAEIERAVTSLQALANYFKGNPAALIRGRGPNDAPNVDVRN